MATTTETGAHVDGVDVTAYEIPNHSRIERTLFDGTLSPDRGLLTPDRSTPGLALELKRGDARRWEVS